MCVQYDGLTPCCLAVVRMGCSELVAWVAYATACGKCALPCHSGMSCQEFIATMAHRIVCVECALP